MTYGIEYSDKTDKIRIPRQYRRKTKTGNKIFDDCYEQLMTKKMKHFVAKFFHYWNKLK